MIEIDEGAIRDMKSNDEEEMHVVGKWFAKNLDVKTWLFLVGLFVQGIILYSAITNKLTNLDERVTRIESSYVPSAVIAEKNATLQQQFAEIKDTQRTQSDDVREIRRLLETRNLLGVEPMK